MTTKPHKQAESIHIYKQTKYKDQDYCEHTIKATRGSGYMQRILRP